MRRKALKWKKKRKKTMPLTSRKPMPPLFFLPLDLQIIQDKLIDPTSVSHLHRITKTLGMLATGAPADARSIVQKARAEAADYR